MTDHLTAQHLLPIIHAPSCPGTHTARPTPPALVCSKCGLQYPVRDGIPVMLIEEATPSDR